MMHGIYSRLTSARQASTTELETRRRKKSGDALGNAEVSLQCCRGGKGRWGWEEGLTTGGAAGASERAKTAAREAFEAWQARNRLPAETDEDLLRPIPPPLEFEVDSPHLLDDDMREVLEMAEVRLNRFLPFFTRIFCTAAPIYLSLLSVIAFFLFTISLWQSLL